MKKTVVGLFPRKRPQTPAIWLIKIAILSCQLASIAFFRSTRSSIFTKTCSNPLSLMLKLKG